MEQPDLNESTETKNDREQILQRLNEIPRELSDLLKEFGELCQSRENSGENIHRLPLLSGDQTNPDLIDRGWSDQIEEVRSKISRLTSDMEELMDKLDQSPKPNSKQQNLI